MVCLLSPLRGQVTLSWNYIGTNDFNATSNWWATPFDSGNAPAGNVLVFPSFINNNTPTLSASINVNSLTLNNGSGLYFFGNFRTLGITQGVNASAATGFVYFRTYLNVDLQGNQTWNVGYELYSEAQVSGAYSLTKTGNGILMLGGDGSGASSYNTFSGGLTVSGGTLRLGGASRFVSDVIQGPVGSGTLTMQSGTTLLPYYVGSGGGRNLLNPVNLANNVTLGAQSQAGYLQFDGLTTITDATAALHLGTGRRLNIYGGLDATNAGTSLTFDGQGTVLIDSTVNDASTSTNISLITASGSAVIFSGRDSLPGTTTLAATNNGYIGIGDGFGENGPADLLSQIASPGTFAGTIGFDSAGETNAFGGTINLTNFTNAGFRGLGSQTSAVLDSSATIVSPSNRVLQLSGVSGGELRVNAPLIDAHVGSVIIGRTDGLGTGTVILDANNTYTGGTTLQSGTLLLGDSTALGTGNLIIPVGASSPVLGAIDGDRTVANNIVINHTGLRIGNQDDTGLSLVLSGIISGVGNLDVHWGDSLTLTNANNTFSGGLTVYSGTVFLAGSSTGAPGSITTGPAGTGTITLNNNTELASTGDDVTLANTIAVTGAVNLGDNENDGSLILTGTISGTGSLTSNVEQLTLTGTNTFSGGLTVKSGELILGSSTNGGFTGGPVGTGRLTLWGDTYFRPRFPATTISLANEITLFGNGYDWVHVDDDEQALNLTLTGLIQGDAGLDWCTPGTLTLTNSGNLFVIDNDSYYNGISVDMRAGTVLIGASSTAHSDESGYWVVDHGPLGKGSLLLYNGTKLGVSSGTQTLHNQLNIYGSSVSFDTSAGNLTLLGQIEGDDVHILKTGSGILTLGGYSNFNGGVEVQAGSLYLGNSSGHSEGTRGPVGSGDLTLMNGTTLGVASTQVGTTTLDNAINLDHTASSNVTIDTANGDLTLGGLISGAAGITKTGTNTLTLSGSGTVYNPDTEHYDPTFNSYTGPTVINGGVLSVSHLANGGSSSGIGSSTNSSSNLILNGGALRYTGTSVSTDRLFTLGTDGGGFTLTSESTLTFANIGTVSFTGANTARTLKFAVNDSSGAIVFNPVLGNADDNTGKTSLVKSGSGILDLRGANTYTGSTWIQGGTLKVGSDSLSNLTALIVDSGASLSSHDDNIAVGSIAGAGTLAIAGPGSFTVALTTGADNTSTTFDGVIQELDHVNSVGLIKTGTGTLTLNGANVYGAGTTINGGMIVAGNNAALGSGSITLNGGGISVANGVTLTNPLIFSGTATVLGGNGIFGTHITADSHVVISPGNSPGTLTFSAGLTLASGTAISFQIQDATGTAGTGYDLISVTGGVLSLTAPANTITFNLNSLNSDGNAGNAANFNPGNSYSWTFATSPNANITGFNANQFHLVNGFTNAINGGSFSFAQGLDQRSLLLNFTPVPEPSTWLMLGSGLGALALKLRRRRR